jgi:predicted nucleotidyltransferase
MNVAEARLESYVAEAVDAVEAGGAAVVAAYVLGSVLLGGFDPGSSDVDVVTVVARPLEAQERAAIVAALDELASPFRRLELVVYAEGAKPPAYELNYPDGEGEAPHWLVLDAAIAQEHARPFAGRPWGDVLRPVSEAETRQAAQESLEWSARQPAGDEFARLNAVRARRYLERGEWITKEEARA